jgi:cytochrome d ubiquinol oxidase subunit II
MTETVVGQLGTLAEQPLFGLPLPELWFALMFFVFGTFLFLDGFDFGVGALFATRDSDEEREQLLAAIGPVWDGNEVWLVVFGGAMFAAFPRVYANLFSRYYLLMFAILGALILRGLAPEMYEQRHDKQWQRWWGRAFVVGSVTAPFFLGVFAANWLLGEPGIVSISGLVVGLAVVALTVVNGVAFLGLKTRGSLRRDLMQYGPKAVGAYLVLVVVALGYLLAFRPAVRDALLSPISFALVVLTVLLAAAYIITLQRGTYLWSMVTAAGMTYGLATLVATLMFPLIDPVTGLTVRSAIVSTLPLNLMTIVSVTLLPLVFVYFGVLYSTFSGPVEAGEAYGGD